MLNNKSLLSALALGGGQAAATYLYVTSYAGTLTSLNLTTSEPTDCSGGPGKTTLEVISVNEECGGAPSWLTHDKRRNVLFCADEGWNTWPNGLIAAYTPQSDGTLELISQAETIVGAVSILLYGKDDEGLAVAYYSDSAFTTWDASDPADIKLLHTDKYELTEPGANPDRQEAPHPHQTVGDPTGKFILIPDLGADVVRVYAAEDDYTVTELDSLVSERGSGPRHATFASYDDATYLYVIHELTNTIVGYAVSYPDGGIAFEELFSIGTHGEGKDVPVGASAAEITVTPDQAFLIASSRNESIWEIPSFDPASNETILSDTLINFSIDPATGALTQLQEVPSGGSFPRHFSFNEATDLVAVIQQRDGRVVVLERDPESGLLGDFVASADVGGEVNAVIFNEDFDL